MAPGKQLARPTAPANVVVRAGTGVVVAIDPSCGPIDAPEILKESRRQALDDAITDAEQFSGLRFATYIGDLGPDPRATAESLLESFAVDAPYAVLVAVSPGQRCAEIVTGTEAALRISDRGARTAVLTVCASCADGDLGGALINAVRILADQAGEIPDHASH